MVYLTIPNIKLWYSQRIITKWTRGNGHWHRNNKLTCFPIVEPIVRPLYFAQTMWKYLQNRKRQEKSGCSVTHSIKSSWSLSRSFSSSLQHRHSQTVGIVRHLSHWHHDVFPTQFSSAAAFCNSSFAAVAVTLWPSSLCQSSSSVYGSRIKPDYQARSQTRF